MAAASSSPSARSDCRLLHEFNSYTKEPQWLECTPAAPWTGIRYVRVETVSSPSWPAWHEIRIFGTG